MNTKKKIGARIAATIAGACMLAGAGVVYQATTAPQETVASASAGYQSCVKNITGPWVLVQHNNGVKEWMASGMRYCDIHAIYADSRGLSINGRIYRNTWVGPLAAWSTYNVTYNWA